MHAYSFYIFKLSEGNASHLMRLINRTNMSKFEVNLNVSKLSLKFEEVNFESNIPNYDDLIMM